MMDASDCAKLFQQSFHYVYRVSCLAILSLLLLITYVSYSDYKNVKVGRPRMVVSFNNVHVPANKPGNPQETLTLYDIIGNESQRLLEEESQLLNNQPSSPILILPRSAYVDLLFKPNSTHKNATVILIGISKAALKSKVITGCESEGYTTREFRVEVFYQYGWIQNHKIFSSLTYDGATLTCYNMPVPRNGSTMFVLYKDKLRREKKIETERKLYTYPHLKQKTTAQTLSHPTIVVCATVYGKPPWLREWLLYQKTIGVDHIHLHAQESFVIEGSMNNSILQQYLNSHYATLDVWKTPLNESQVYYYQQVLFYEDCMHRYRNRFDYLLLYDTDDFFVPRVVNKSDIHYYVKKIFQNPTVSSARFSWSLHYPDCGLTQSPSKVKDGNVTNYLSSYRHFDKNYKSMYKLSSVLEVGVHVTPMEKLLGKYTNVPRSLSYVAHLRKNAQQWHQDPLLACKDTTASS